MGKYTDQSCERISCWTFHLRQRYDQPNQRSYQPIRACQEECQLVFDESMQGIFRWCWIALRPVEPGLNYPAFCFFLVFLLEPAATKAMTSLRMRELHFFLTQSSCQSERSLIHVIILSHKKLCKKKEILQKNKNILCEAFIIQSLFISPNLQTFTFSSFFFFRTFQHIVHNAGNLSHYELM